jgi:hypothetical protein
MWPRSKKRLRDRKKRRGRIANATRKDYTRRFYEPVNVLVTTNLIGRHTIAEASAVIRTRVFPFSPE